MSLKKKTVGQKVLYFSMKASRPRNWCKLYFFSVYSPHTQRIMNFLSLAGGGIWMHEEPTYFLWCCFIQKWLTFLSISLFFHFPINFFVVSQHEPHKNDNCFCSDVGTHLSCEYISYCYNFFQTPLFHNMNPPKKKITIVSILIWALIFHVNLLLAAL